MAGIQNLLGDYTVYLAQTLGQLSDVAPYHLQVTALRRPCHRFLRRKSSKFGQSRLDKGQQACNIQALPPEKCIRVGPHLIGKIAGEHSGDMQGAPPFAVCGVNTRGNCFCKDSQQTEYFRI